MDYAKITKIIEGLIIIVLAAVILADGVPGLPDVAGEPLLTLPHFMRARRNKRRLTIWSFNYRWPNG